MKRLLACALALLLLLALAAPVFAQGGSVHVVQRGENLFRIALRYGVSVDALVRANGLSDAGRIYAGQRLVIPTGSSGSGAGSSASASSSVSGVHVVQRGENLFRIALRHGVSVHALAAANGISNPSFIYVGQRLTIPGGGAAPRPSTSSSPPVTPASSSAERWIDVDLGAQRLTAYEGDTAVRSTPVSTGLALTPTPAGRYRIYVKYASTSMSGADYHYPDVPHVMFFYKGYSIHGCYWHSNFGHPMSHGCINMPRPEAQWLFNWASVGTLVNIHH